MKKMKMETKSGIERNIEAIAQLFPNTITEVKNNRGGGEEIYRF